MGVKMVRVWLKATKYSEKSKDEVQRDVGSMITNAGSIPATSTNREMADMQLYTCPTQNAGNP